MNPTRAKNEKNLYMNLGTGPAIHMKRGDIIIQKGDFWEVVRVAPDGKRARVESLIEEGEATIIVDQYRVSLRKVYEDKKGRK